ncbi:hypothetical protein CTI12_AA114230 [Artemisia annua]|uniref:Retrotransposon Copia-like N-terminal domain-containing protein n=1 Tax=Artemisia annua TaxID=35608 RepID=A0A2U1P4T0_ARTAN|nr:hypothetical protein CTI12_AA114230 [Artemisia annua]
MTSASSSSETAGMMNNQMLFQNPLFLHPSDGPGTLMVTEKLLGAQNYRSWRRLVEIALSTKWKLGFIRGTVPRSVDGASLQEQWDTCNNLLQLETRFALSNGSHKYKLNRETYGIMQSGRYISEYYTNMKCVWEELDSMNELPRIVNITPEVAVFLQALNTQKEDVESACSLLQQEESQRGVFGNSGHVGVESTALYSKGDHPPEKCWEKIGYPVWHYKYKQGQKVKSVVKNGVGNVKRTAAVVESSGNVVFTSKQFEQLMKSLPHFNQNAQEPIEMDHPFGEGTIYYFSCINGVIEGWIIDTRASDHMSPDSEDLIDVQTLKYKQMINLPNGHTSVISQVGNKDFVSTTQPVPAIPDPPSSSTTHTPEPATSENEVHDDEVPPVEQIASQVFEPVFGTTDETQPAGARKSSRVPVTPSWLKDYVTPHLPRANQVSVTSLQSQFPT